MHNKDKKLNYYISRYWLALTVSFLIFSPYLSRYADEFNRFIFHWDKRDLTALGLSIAIVGTLLFVIFKFCYVNGSKRLRNFFNFLFVSIIILSGVSGITQFITFYFKSKNITLNPETPVLHIFAVIHHGHVLSILWLILIICIAVKKWQQILKKYCITLCFIVSPVVPLFMLNAFNYADWQSGSGDLNLFINKQNKNARKMPDIYIFIFDEWSYERSFKNKKLAGSFTNLQNFKEQALVFHAAYSPAPNTFNSMPAFLFQTHLKFIIEQGDLGFVENEYIPARKFGNIFDYPRNLGYATCITGSYIPYGSLLENVVDFSYSQSVAKRFGNGFSDILGYHLFTTAQVLSPKLLYFVVGRIEAYFFNKFQIKRIKAEDDFFTTIIRKQNHPTFGVFHYMLPHFPYIFSSDGIKPLFVRYRETLADYTGNLAYLDKKIGFIISELKKAGKFEDSFIVLMSDHSWREDPAAKHKAADLSKCHIPLLIKFPLQKSPVEISANFSTNYLGSLINEYLKGGLNSMNAKAFVNDEKKFFTGTCR